VSGALIERLEADPREKWIKGAWSLVLVRVGGFCSLGTHKLLSI